MEATICTAKDTACMGQVRGPCRACSLGRGLCGSTYCLSLSHPEPPHITRGGAPPAPREPHPSRTADVLCAPSSRCNTTNSRQQVAANRNPHSSACSPVQLPCNGQRCRGLPRAWRPVEQQVGKLRGARGTGAGQQQAFHVTPGMPERRGVRRGWKDRGQALAASPMRPRLLSIHATERAAVQPADTHVPAGCPLTLQERAWGRVGATMHALHVARQHCPRSRLLFLALLSGCSRPPPDRRPR